MSTITSYIFLKENLGCIWIVWQRKIRLTNEIIKSILQDFYKLVKKDLFEIFDGYISGKIIPIKQKGKISYAKNITSDERKITLCMTAKRVIRLVNGLNPYKPPILEINDKSIVLTEICDKLSTDDDSIKLNLADGTIYCKYKELV